MENEKRRKIIMIMALIAVGVALASNIFTIIGAVNRVFVGDTTKIVILNLSVIFSIVTLIVACLYIGTEFKKSSAKYYKAFILAYIAEQLISVLYIGASDGISLGILAGSVVVFGALNMLLNVNDLGAKKSYALSFIVLGWNVFSIIFATANMTVNSGVTATLAIATIIRILGELSLSVVLVIMTGLKYYDKKLRSQADACAENRE